MICVSPQLHGANSCSSQSVYSMDGRPSSPVFIDYCKLSAVVSAVVFLTVLNLRNLERVFNWVYSSWTMNLEDKMVADPSEPWRKRGAQLQNAAQFIRIEKIRSNWWYVWYSLVKLWGALRAALSCGCIASAGWLGCGVQSIYSRIRRRLGRADGTFEP